jgi:ABC-type antimicrobial peptide transport system permease subunit
MRMVGMGAVVGLTLGVGVSVFLRSLLFEVAPADPVTLGGSTLVLLVAAMAAALIPALKAVRVNPLEALRAE